MDRLIGFLYILLCNFAGDLIIVLTGLPFPGAVLGLLLMLALLLLKVVKLEQVESASTLLISFMLLFILPGAVKVMEVFDKFTGIIPQIFGVAIISALLCILSTAWVSKWVSKMKNRFRKAGNA
ncbi:MAG: CidA/LrgA family protein [Bacillota bacterium]|nr:CidA/LrgA family protein [Bacillota bacterium]